MLCQPSQLLRRWQALLCEEALDPAAPAVRQWLDGVCREAQTWMDTLFRKADQTCLWADLPDPGDLYTRDKICYNSFVRVETMVRAFAVHGSALRHSEALRQAIAHALGFLTRCWYNCDTRSGGEWWYKEIGIPLIFNRCLAMMEGWLDEAFRRRCMDDILSFTSEPQWMVLEHPEQSTGANRVWKCLALAGVSVLRGDTEGLCRAQRQIADVFAYTETGDGFYRDGSFVQHQKFAYNGGYGASLLDVIVDYLELLADSPWQLPPEQLQVLMDWVEHSWEPFLVGGALMDMVRGREIAREHSEEHKSGHRMLSSLLRLSCSLPDAQAKPLKRKLKRWILDERYHPFVPNAQPRLAALAQNLLQDEALEPWTFEAGCMIFAGMDRVLHRRSRYTAGLSMCSRRIGRYESIHDENVRGWYQSEGRLYLCNGDQGQYSDHYHATVNAMRLAGITVDRSPRQEVGVNYGKEPPVQTDCAGGASVDGLYGLAVMEVLGEASDLHAQKAWFFFDDEIVCLGAGITGTGSLETVVENRRVPVDGSFCLTVDAEQAAAAGERSGVRWMHLQTPGDGIGYVFPQPSRLEWLSEERSGSWYGINRNTGAKEQHVNRFVEAVIPHDAQNTACQYVLLPGMSAAETQRCSTAPAVQIVSNTPQLQAAAHPALGLLGAYFWQENGKAGPLSCSGKAAVMTRRQKEKLSLAAADPTWKAQEPVRLIWDEPACAVMHADEGLRVLQLAPQVIVEADLRQTHGRTLQIDLQMK